MLFLITIQILFYHFDVWNILGCVSICLLVKRGLWISVGLCKLNKEYKLPHFNLCSVAQFWRNYCHFQLWLDAQFMFMICKYVWEHICMAYEDVWWISFKLWFRLDCDYYKKIRFLLLMWLWSGCMELFPGTSCSQSAVLCEWRCCHRPEHNSVKWQRTRLEVGLRVF